MLSLLMGMVLDLHATSLSEAYAPVTVETAGLSPVALQQLTVGRGGDSCWVQMPLSLWGKDVPRSHVLTLTPRLTTTTDTVYFPAMVVYGRWAYYHEVRSGVADNASDMHLRAADVQDGHQRFYARAVAWQPWMDHCGLTLCYEETDGCGQTIASWEQVVTQTPPPPVVVEPQPVPQPKPRPRTRERQLIDHVDYYQGTAYVDFPVGGTVIYPTYHNNRQELEKVHAIIDSLRADTTVTLRHITLRGCASPEGSYISNERLARARANAFRQYVIAHFGISADLVSSDYEAEDWEGVRRSLEASTLPERASLMALIDREPDPDTRLQLIATAYPRVYKHLLDSVFPYLRRTDYRIDYTGRYTEEVLLEEEAAADDEPVDTVTAVVTPVPVPADSTPAPAWGVPETFSNFQTYRPVVALKTNLLFDALLAPNVEVELPLGRNDRWSLMAEVWFPWWRLDHNPKGDVNPYLRSDQRPTKTAYELLTIGAELRYWIAPRCNGGRPCLTGLFAALYGAGGKYDLGRHGRGDQGEFTSLGLSLGYAWPIGRHWNLELSAAAGYIGGPKVHYQNEFDDTHLIYRRDGTYRYVGPTKLKLSLVWLLGSKSKKGGAQ